MISKLNEISACRNLVEVNQDEVEALFDELSQKERELDRLRLTQSSQGWKM